MKISGNSEEQKEDAVKNVQYTWLDKNSLKISWDSPASATNSTKYSIKCVFESQTKSTSTSNTSCILKDFELCASYHCTFDATDKSSSVKFVTVEEEISSTIEGKSSINDLNQPLHTAQFGS